MPEPYKGVIDLTKTSILKDDALDGVSNRAKELSKRLESVLYFSDVVDSQNLIFLSAKDDAVEYMKNVVHMVIQAEALKAMFMTDEYNFHLYVDALMEAIGYHGENLVTFYVTGEENITLVTVDFSPLGEILEWENAVIFARAELGVGGEEPDPEDTSFYWAYKVYGPGRLGWSVSSTRKKEGTKDVTEKFSGLYEKTIQTRLKYTKTGQAPFWYLIEFGNAPGTMTDRGGEPFPRVAPTHFASKTELAIARIYELTLYRMLNKTLSDYGNALLKSFSRGTSGINITDVNQVFSEIAKITEELMSKEYPLEPVDLSEMNALMAKIKGVAEFTRRGRRVKQLRATSGQWAPSPIPTSRLKRKK